MKTATLALALVGLLMNTGCGTPSPASNAPADGKSATLTALERKIARFAPVDIAANVDALPANEREAVTHLVRAAQLFDDLFMLQSWAGNQAMLATLKSDQSPEGKAELHYFLINKG